MKIARMASRPGVALAAAAAALALVGCGQFRATVSGGDPRTARLTEASMAQSWERALQLLAQGDEAMAEAELVLARESPEYRERARMLLRQVRTPPDAYFPDDYFHVALSRGQSLSSLAERYLGNALAFYALARYNAIRTPARVTAGQRIRIPLTAHAARVRRAETGAVDTDDPIGDPAAAARAGGDTATQGDTAVRGPQTEADAAEPGEPDPAGDPDAAERRERVAFHYRRATQAFQQQDLHATIRHCRRVLELDPEHENCKLYRARARELERRLEEIPGSG